MGRKLLYLFFSIFCYVAFIYFYVIENEAHFRGLA